MVAAQSSFLFGTPKNLCLPPSGVHPKLSGENSTPQFQSWVCGQPNARVPSGKKELFCRPVRDFSLSHGAIPSHEWLGYCQEHIHSSRNLPD
jgi:hypothetical protein